MASNNTTLLPPASIGVSAVENWIHQIVFFGLLGFLSFVGNTAVAIGIIRNKELRTRFFTIICFVAVSRAALCLHWVTTAVFRILRTLELVPMNMKRSYCYLLNFNGYYSATLEVELLGGLVVDRILAVVFFTYYRHLTNKHAVAACAVASAVTVILKIVPSLFGVDFNQVIPCVIAYSPLHPVYTVYHVNATVAFVGITFALNLALLLYIRFWHLPKLCKVSKNTGDRSGLETFKAQSHLLPVMYRIVFTHCGLTLSGKIVAASTIYTPPALSLRLMTYGGISSTIDMFVNLIILLASNKDLRRAAFPFRNNTVNSNNVVLFANANGRNAAGTGRRV